jgi:hypothetical protein
MAKAVRKISLLLERAVGARCIHAQALGDLLDEAQGLRGLLLGEQIHLQTEVRAAIRLPRRLNGNGSKGRTNRRAKPELITIHPRNQTRWAKANRDVPAARVTKTAARWETFRRAST